MAVPLPSHKLALLNACTSASVLTFGTYTLKSGRQSPYFFNAGLLHTATLIDILGAAYAATILDYIRSASSSLPSLGRPSQQDRQDSQQQQKIDHHFADFDIIFGTKTRVRRKPATFLPQELSINTSVASPSYKGIPLAIETLGALRRLAPQTYGSKSYAFNRKEKKDHGEGGGIVGAPLRGKNVLIVDDVVTAGTALREAVGIIEAEGGRVVGVVVALDRMERMPSMAEMEGRGNAEDEEGEGAGRRRSAVQELRRNLGVPVLAVLTLDDLIGFAGGERSQEELERLRAYRERYIARE